jgi:hypothetical protein
VKGGNAVKNMQAKFATVTLIVMFVLVGHAAVAQQPPSEDVPDNVAGKWTIYSKNVDNNESVTKYVEIVQNGNVLSGHFKGPNQSGGIQGSIHVHHIEFSTKTRNVLTFRGQVEGDHMRGMYGIHGRHAEWEAVRQN